MPNTDEKLIEARDEWIEAGRKFAQLMGVPSAAEQQRVYDELEGEDILDHYSWTGDDVSKALVANWILTNRLDDEQED